MLLEPIKMWPVSVVAERPKKDSGAPGMPGGGMGGTATIGNRVWLDLNGDGIQDVSEADVNQARADFARSVGQMEKVYAK